MKVGAVGRMAFVVIFTICVSVLQRVLKINWFLAFLLLALICECVWRLIKLVKDYQSK